MSELSDLVVVQSVESVHQLWMDGYWDVTPYCVAYLHFCDDGDNLVGDFTEGIEYGSLRIKVSFIELTECDYMYTEDTIRHAVMETYDEMLPEYCIEFAGEREKTVVENMLSINIARNTRRGPGKKISDNIMIYKGKSNGLVDCDGGLIASKAWIDGKLRYAVVQHPLFTQYGFKLVYDEVCTP